MSDQHYGPPQYSQPGQYAPVPSSQYGQPNPYLQHAYPAPKKRASAGLHVEFFLALQVLFLIWVIAGAHTGAGQPTDCGTLSAQTCNDAANTGTAIGVGIIIAFWVVVDFILGITYGIYRLATRR